jgi:DNA polymerase I-like protein with 3'-5' exonuclease and polymerase domains
MNGTEGKLVAHTAVAMGLATTSHISASKPNVQSIAIDAQSATLIASMMFADIITMLSTAWLS